MLLRPELDLVDLLSLAFMGTGGVARATAELRVGLLDAAPAFAFGNALSPLPGAVALALFVDEVVAAGVVVEALVELLAAAAAGTVVIAGAAVVAGVAGAAVVAVVAVVDFATDEDPDTDAARTPFPANGLRRDAVNLGLGLR